MAECQLITTCCVFPQRIVSIPHVAVTAPACEVAAFAEPVGVARPVASAMQGSNVACRLALNVVFMIWMLEDAYVIRCTREMTALKVKNLIFL